MRPVVRQIRCEWIKQRDKGMVAGGREKDSRSRLSKL